MQDLSSDYGSIFKEKKYKELMMMAESAQIDLAMTLSK
jgi:hypothetical protein